MFHKTYKICEDCGVLVDESYAQKIPYEIFGFQNSNGNYWYCKFHEKPYQRVEIRKFEDGSKQQISYYVKREVSEWTRVNPKTGKIINNH